MLPIRLRDFIEDADGWLYAVSTYDNEERAGCILRYVPDKDGERVNGSGRRYRKLDFDEAYALIRKEKPEYADTVQRVPLPDIRKVYKPEAEMGRVAKTHPRVAGLLSVLRVPEGHAGCTGSILLGLDNAASDIDLVVYGKDWFSAQENLKRATLDGRIEGMSEEMWRKVYEKRRPEIPFDAFVRHEERKWNRGQIGGTYFDLLFTRSYYELQRVIITKGTVLRKDTITARVTDASLAFDNPSVYEVEHDEYTRVLSFTHTYSGQALAGETIEACGVLEKHGCEHWLIVGTTREARGEYIVSRTLLSQ